MKVLGIESSGTRGGVALFEEPRLLAEECLDLRGAHTERLLPALGRMLADRGTAFSEVGGVAVSLGPGSFTGLRSGLALGKGLAYAAGLTLAGVPTHEVLAAGSGGDGWILAISDARRGEVFSSLYERGEDGLRERLQTRLGSVEAVAESVLGVLPGAAPLLHVVGDGTCPLEDVVRSLASRGVDVVSSARSEPRPGTVARLGAGRIVAGVRDDPMTLEPLYVRRSDAEEKGRR